MKLCKRIIVFALAIVMSVVTPMQIFAAAQVQYISELRIGYGEAGKAALESEGFTVWQNLNANEGGNGSAVWLGYTTTTDSKEAITDVALMNMKGGYSFDAYTQEIEELNRQVTEQLAGFKTAIAEFRTNYEAGNPFAQQALQVMNGFTDDETTDTEGRPMGIGDVFLSEETPDETLHRIFLEGNTEAVGAIETALALACIEVEEETLLTRIEDSEYPEELDPQKNSARTALKNAFEDFHSTAISLGTVAEEIESYEGGAEAFFARQTLSDEELYTYSLNMSEYLLLTETPFGNTGMSLFEFAMLDAETPDENGEVLEDEYLEMLAQSMTPGQLGIVANVGIMTILLNAAAGNQEQDAADEFEANTEPLEQTISVYYGVDRQLFEDTDGIALTGTALREKAAAQAGNFGKDANADETLKFVLTAASGAAVIAGSVVMSLGIKAMIAAKTAKANAMLSANIQAFLYSRRGALAAKAAANAMSGVSVAGIVATAVGVIAIIVGVVLLIFAILAWIEKPVVPNTKYTRIPKVLVEKPEGQRDFIAYYCARLAGSDEDETESTKCYGDLNGLNTIDQWVGLYYSKNPSLGAPITTEMMQSAGGTLNSTDSQSYCPVHMFGSTAAANLNQYNTGNGAKAIYIFFRTDTSAQYQSASVFTANNILVSVVTLIFGAGLATAVTYVVMRKKKAQV